MGCGSQRNRHRGRRRVTRLARWQDRPAAGVRGPDDEANLGSVYGLSVSAQSDGSLLAAPLSSLTASLLGLPALHVMSAGLLIATATGYAAATRRGSTLS